LRDYIPRIHAAAGELVVLGNGTPEQAKWFVEDYGMTTPVFTDPALASHRVVGARRPKFIDPRTILRAIEARREGFRQTGTKGSAMQLGGVFVITPAGEAPYAFLSRFAGDHPPHEAPVAVLEAAAKRPA
jgi:AhpC/TSA antioxidant enzyme